MRNGPIKATFEEGDAAENVWEVSRDIVKSFWAYSEILNTSIVSKTGKIKIIFIQSQYDVLMVTHSYIDFSSILLLKLT